MSLLAGVKHRFYATTWQNVFSSKNWPRTNQSWWVPKLKKKKKNRKLWLTLDSDFGLIIPIGPSLNRNTISNYTKRRRAKIKGEKERLDFRERERGNEENGISLPQSKNGSSPLVGSKPLAFRLASISPNGTPPQTQMGNLIKLNIIWIGKLGLLFFFWALVL